jgi:hypothetical protein
MKIEIAQSFSVLVFLCALCDSVVNSLHLNPYPIAAVTFWTPLSSTHKQTGRLLPHTRRHNAELQTGRRGTSVATVLGNEQDLPHAGPRRSQCCGQAQALHPRHVPVPERRRAARRAPRRLHRDRHSGPLQADERLPRAAPHGLGRLRPARRAVRGGEERSPANYDAEQHRYVPQADQIVGLLLRLGSRSRYHRPEILQMDPVDLPDDLRQLVRPG